MSLSQLSSPALTSLLPTFALGDTIAYPTISNAVCTIAPPLHSTQLPGAIPSRSLDYITVPDSFRASTTIDQPRPGSIYNAVCTPTTPFEPTTTTFQPLFCGLESSPEKSPTAFSDVPHTKKAHQAKKAPRPRPDYWTINVKGFLEKLEGRPIFTRALFQHAKEQLEKAKKGEDITLRDHDGNETVFPTKRQVASGRRPVMIYNHYQIMADPKPWRNLPGAPVPEGHKKHTLQGVHISDRIKYARLPVYIDPQRPPVCYNCHQSAKHAFRERNPKMAWWAKSSARETLQSRLQAMRHRPQVKKIVCLGLGSPSNLDGMLYQHLAAITIADELNKMYKDTYSSHTKPIEIIAQDPVYNKNDEEFLALFKYPIRVVQDPDAFLAIDKDTLIFSVYAEVEIQQFLADMIAEEPHMCPAAVLWTPASTGFGADTGNVNYWHEQWWYTGNAATPRTVEMMKLFEDVWPNKGLEDFERTLNSGNTDWPRLESKARIAVDP